VSFVGVSGRVQVQAQAQVQARAEGQCKRRTIWAPRRHCSRDDSGKRQRSLPSAQARLSHSNPRPIPFHSIPVHTVSEAPVASRPGEQPRHGIIDIFLSVFTCRL
jgi:hypothetical protein